LVTLITGCAGFIGMHVAKALLERGDTVVGIDNLNDYYDPKLKSARLDQIFPHPGFKFIQASIADSTVIEAIFLAEKPQRVINLAAQVGVRNSVNNPLAYVDSNLLGFINILEGCRNSRVEHLVYASSSSVYGANTRSPFSTFHGVDHPISLYAATKKANELMAHSYSHLYGFSTTGLRFFTVYGPWGRPDMALCLFTKAILEGRPLNVFNKGEMFRDFTYIDDVVEGVLGSLDNVPQEDHLWDNENPNPSGSSAAFKIYNVGNSRPISLLYLIDLLEKNLNKKVNKNYLDMQPGDVVSTYADIEPLFNAVGFKPSTSIEEGVSKFIAWYLKYYQYS